MRYMTIVSAATVDRNVAGSLWNEEKPNQDSMAYDGSNQGADPESADVDTVCGHRYPWTGGQYLPPQQIRSSSHMLGARNMSDAIRVLVTAASHPGGSDLRWI